MLSLYNSVMKKWTIYKLLKDPTKKRQHRDGYRRDNRAGKVGRSSRIRKRLLSYFWVDELEEGVTHTILKEFWSDDLSFVNEQEQFYQDQHGWTDGTRRRVSEGQHNWQQQDFTGNNNNSARPINVYDHNTRELIAENVNATQWCRDNGYCRVVLTDTAKRKYAQHKGIYARYVDDEQDWMPKRPNNWTR